MRGELGIGCTFGSPALTVAVRFRSFGRRLRAQVPVEILLATRNRGKVSEIETILAGLAVVLRLPQGMPEIEETGGTYVENALLKARAVARRFGGWALA